MLSTSIDIDMTTATPPATLLFHSTNPGTALGGRRTGFQPLAESANFVSASSSMPRLFKSDAANNYYNAMKMKNSLTNSNKKIGSTFKINADVEVIAPGKQISGTGECDIGKKTSFETARATVKQKGSHGGTISNKNEAAGISPTPPNGVPPITSFDWSYAGGGRDFLSATSSITHCDSFHQTDSFSSVATEAEEATAATAVDTVTTHDGRKNGESEFNAKDKDDDPPIGEYPSPVCNSSADNTLTYKTCLTYVAVPKELKLDVITEDLDDGRANSCVYPNKEREKSIDQGLLFYQATSPFISDSLTVANMASSGVSKIDPGMPPRDKISHALTVVDVLSVIGSDLNPPEKSNALSPAMNLRSVRSMSPLLFKKKKTIPDDVKGRVKSLRKDVESCGKNGASDSTAASSPFESGIHLHSVRSMSPCLFTSENKLKKYFSDNASDGSTAASTAASTINDPAESQRERRSSAIENAVKDNKIVIEEKGTKPPKSNIMILPPLIPTRAILIDSPCQPQPIVISSDDDGSVECSVKITDNKKFPPDDAQIAVKESPCMKEISTAVSDDNSSNESSLFTNLEVDKMTPKVANAELPKSMRKSKKDQAKEKLARRLPRVSKTADGKEYRSDHDFIAHMTSDDNSNINSPITTCSKMRKREKLQKIIDYRKKAAPTVEKTVLHKTLDASLVPKENKKAEKIDESCKSSLGEKNLQTEICSKRDNQEGDVRLESHTSNREHLMQEVPKHIDLISKKAVVIECGGPMNELGKQYQQSDSKLIKSRDFSAPISRIDVLHTAYSADTGISLPPELQSGKTVKIWHEETTEDEEASKGGNAETLADIFMTCGKHNSDDDLFTYDLNHDVNSIIEERKARNVNEVECIYDTKQKVLLCGVDTHQLKKDVFFEVNEVLREIEDGLRRSARSIFLTCDITQSGGVEVMTSNVANTNDQLFGRAPLPTTQPTSTNRVKNTQRSSMFDSVNLAQKKSDVIQIKAGDQDETRNMYVARLRAAALKHM